MREGDDSPKWVKATASGTGNCVEVAPAGDAVLLRDSKDPAGPVVSMSRATWAAYLDAAKQGRFDL
jgi:uncharacterized protein DUF397